MKIAIFDIEKGIYLTQLESIEADFHSHPAMEIIVADKGTFNLSTKEATYTGLKFAVIESNILHKLSFKNADIKILLVEHRDVSIIKFLHSIKISLTNGMYVIREDSNKLFIDTLLYQISNSNMECEYDPRVQNTINFIQTSQVSYFELKKELNKVINLSESRLSHLFKQQTGVSIKRYFVWSKLKQSVHAHLHNKESLFSSLVEAGFYDQPHFNKVYKSLIGTSPAKTYNSRMLQE